MARKEPLFIADDFQLPLEAFAIPPQYQVRPSVICIEITSGSACHAQFCVAYSAHHIAFSSIILRVACRTT